jgi:hypothetical protein
VKYTLLIYGDEKALANMTPEGGREMMAAYSSYTQALKDAGAYLGGHQLQPSMNASTVRTGKVLHGPFAETHEHLGGYYLIEAADLDAALAWAKRCPGSNYGAVEVRPVVMAQVTAG